MQIYKVGDRYKYISTNLFEKNLKSTKEKKGNNENYEKYFNNLVRAKTNISNLILCNDFTYFITLTFNNKHDRNNLSSLRNKINNKLRKLRKINNLDFKFLFIPEKHKNGAWHFHGVIDNSFKSFIYKNKNGFFNCSIFDYFGFNSVSIINDKDRVSSYITKYICKNFTKRLKNEHLYYASKNLKKPLLLKSFYYDSNDLKSNFFDFSNDYCSIKYCNKILTIKTIDK